MGKNALIFLLQTALIFGGVKGAQRLGKTAVSALGVVLALLANFFVLKQISLLGLIVTCSDSYVIGHLMCLNLLQQMWGKKEAQKTVLLSFFVMLFFATLSQVHLLYTPAASDFAQAHYSALLTVSPRLFAASLVTFYAVQQLDIFLFGKIVERLPHLSWKFRSAISLVISQCVDTLLFTLLGLYGIVESWVAVFWMSFAIKCGVIALMTTVWREKRSVLQ